MNKQVFLIDTTLREGAQTVGVYFTREQKKRIIAGLAQIGVTEVEIGIASLLNDDLGEIIAFSRRFHPHLAISLWCRCREEDILAASVHSPDRLSLSIPVSDLHLHTKLGKDRTWAKRRLQAGIRTARAEGLEVAVGFEDATRADQRFLEDMAGMAEDNGAFRIRLADTVGLATPHRMIALVEAMRQSVHRCAIGVHTHNDFGMATANAMAALEAGATWADGTILGLGERSGCARLEELVGYLGMMRSDSGIQPLSLRPLAEYVARITHRTIEDSRPVLGSKIFHCETGLHLQGLYKDPSTYEPYPPEQVGAKRCLLIGAKSGRKAIQTRLARLGIEMDDKALLHATRELRQTASSLERTLDDTDLLRAGRTGRPSV